MSNRTSLSSNSGLWPNVIRCVRVTTDPVEQGEGFDLAIYYQAGTDATGEVALSFLLDPDTNPWNGNEVVVDGGMIDIERLQAIIGMKP